jgi:hypothetical protein
MRARLAAAAAGALLIAAVIFAFALSSNPPVAGTTGVEPVRPSVVLNAGVHQCQALARVPRGADRMRVLVNLVAGGARELHVEVRDARGHLSSGDLRPVTPGEKLINLRPRTESGHPAEICFFNRGRGQIMLGGDVKRIRESPKGLAAQKQGIASVVLLRPGSASGFSQTGEIADRYRNAQTGLTGGWSLWVAVVFAIAAGLIALWFVVLRPGRSS